LSKVDTKLHSLNELDDINKELIPLKEIADRELASIYGLTGMVYTPHLDIYMQVCLKRAAMLVCLKKQGIIPVTDVEIISAELDVLHKRVRSKKVVEYKGNYYIRRFTPLKLSKSGKSVQKWAKFWLLQKSEEGGVDRNWESQVHEIWPAYFLIRAVEM